MPSAPIAQLGLGEVFVYLPVGVPQAQDADELRARIGKQRMRVIGGLARFRRALARILDTQERGDDDHLAQATVLLRGHQHARQFDVHRQARHLPADRRQPPLRIDRTELQQLLPAIGHGAFVRRFQERKLLDAPQPKLQHAQDHARQRRAPDLRVGEGRARGEIRLRVQPVTDALGDTPAAAHALVGAGLRNRLDMQPVQLLPRAVALDARIARIHHVADARHRQRGFGHVGRQHQAPARARVEHAVLVGRRQPRVQRHHFGLTVFAPLQRLVRIANLTLARQEHQHIATRVDAGDLVDRRHDGVVDGAFAIAPNIAGVAVARFAFERAVAHLHRESAAFHVDHRRVIEMPREPLGVDGGRSDDQLEVGTLAQQLFEIAQQEVDVEAALVRFVHDDGVVGGQPPVAGDLRQQNAVGHELDARVLTHAIGEAHLEPHRGAQWGVEFFSHARGHRARSDTPRLRAADHAGRTPPGCQAQLGQLGGLARTGLTGNHHHRMVADERDDAIGFARDRQLRIQRDRRLLRGTRLPLRL